jgi:hypothetical protein
MPNVFSQRHDVTVNSFYREIELLLIRDFELTTIKVIPFSAGTHWISTPLKLKAEAVNHDDSELLAKVVAGEGLQVYQEIVANKNTRFARNGITDLEFESSASALEILRQEELFLKACQRANIFVPAPRGVFEFTGGAVLLMEFVNGLPLERVGITEKRINAVFTLVRGLHRQQLVHGDIRRANFLATRESGICLIDHLWLNGNIERALSYDLMSAICHLSLSADPAIVLRAAHKHFSAPELRNGIPFLNFITRRLTKRKRAQILQIILAL